MKQILKYTGYILVLLVIGFLIWKFYYIIIWILVAAVLSFVAQPLVELLDRIHIKKIRFPHTLSVLLSLTVILLFLIGIVSVFVPLIINQAETIAKIDVDSLTSGFRGSLQWIDEKLHEFGAIPEGQTMQDFLVIQAKSIVNFGNVGNFLGGFISAVGSMFIGIVSILFITFFFLKDENSFEEGLLLFIPLKHHDATRKVISESKHLLKRYFIGVFLEVLGVMSLIALGLSIFGFENVLLIGFFGGIMNIIPYIGPIIGSILGISLGITTTLALGSFEGLLLIILKLTGVFVVVQFIDNNILVPMIYSKSVKSHPLEIFLIIIIGGGLAGLPGMLFAVPVYTLLRVIAKEFLQQFRVVQKLTRAMD